MTISRARREAASATPAGRSITTMAIMDREVNE
jgi:hypothetical protein